MINKATRTDNAGPRKAQESNKFRRWLRPVTWFIGLIFLGIVIATFGPTIVVSLGFSISDIDSFRSSISENAIYFFALRLIVYAFVIFVAIQRYTQADSPAKMKRARFIGVLFCIAHEIIFVQRVF